MRLIDADELKRNHMFYHEVDNRSYAEERDIDETPTIDAVEVVHCRDCKYYDVNLADGTTCFCTRLELFNEHDWFCADGERNEKL